MMPWLANITRNESVPLVDEHVSLYSYFPQVNKGMERPYVWRLLSPNKVIIASHIKPTSNNAKEAFVSQGKTYDFKLVFRRERSIVLQNDNGKRRRKNIAVKDIQELKKRVERYAFDRGGDVRFVRISGLTKYRPGGKISVPICHAVGKVYVRDPILFEQLLCHGGPGTGKAYGLGMWYLPELMGENE